MDNQNDPVISGLDLITFPDNRLAQALFGPQGVNLRLLEKELNVTIYNRGNELRLKGSDQNLKIVQDVLTQIYRLIDQGFLLSHRDWQQAIASIRRNENTNLVEIYQEGIKLPTKKQSVYPRTIGQRDYIRSMNEHDIVFGLGPAGTGKTYLAMAMALSCYFKGSVKKIILARPAIEAGEKLGFLPGDLVEKVDPYLRPLYDALHDMMSSERTDRMLDRGEIEIAPLAFMRGRTLNDAFVILDEAQNATRAQMKMFLTRLGFQSKCVITGDQSQIDLAKKDDSGLGDAVRRLKNIRGISVHELKSVDVVRHHLVQKIIDAYDKQT